METLPAAVKTALGEQGLAAEDHRTYYSVKPDAHGCILSSRQFSFAVGIFLGIEVMTSNGVECSWLHLSWIPGYYRCGMEIKTVNLAEL